VDLDTYAKAVTAASLLLTLVMFFIAAATLVLWLTALIHCIHRKEGVDRLTWVVIIIFVPFLGPIIYFIKSRTTAPLRARPARSAPEATAPPPSVVAYDENAVAFDHSAMLEEKQRVQAINEALRASGASRRGQ
jgi:CBS domain containing-hemolysin-like protein